ncbi:toprim domain-containing protein [Acinetobacter baumannii]|uniref:toprim domain-containing protein n=1 Tax=Acinetobacter baumannii TaxID=470 RepID=UPI0026DFCF9A|nr:toprim domain-containing protein [Acinetobacter baumannii]MDO5926349.1 toprim domain-containing protein [Acinetobacter baumannii]HCJ6328381.1 toprim domain-containing protein [Acinetobacter baumannii]HCJ6595690.1 toprim domain-containing protein [Acinetobacter baumannii]HCJ6599576.1 toprim domain-containing protein [Acinetobacter baumannii]HCJ6666057.1 toprim domain-containing protein [Acinetobacter baumannii]
MTPLRHHLHGRLFNPDLYNNIVVDEENQILTVYLHNMSGQIVGYQKYNPNCEDKTGKDPKNTRYFTYRTPGQNAVWGLEFLDSDRPELFIVEGIFKASVLHLLGFNAIAILTSSPSPSLLNWIYTLPYQAIAIGDADKAGENLVRKIGQGATSPKDLDLMEPEEIVNFAIKQFIKAGRPNETVK